MLLENIGSRKARSSITFAEADGRGRDERGAQVVRADRRERTGQVRLRLGHHAPAADGEEEVDAGGEQGHVFGAVARVESAAEDERLPVARLVRPGPRRHHVLLPVQPGRAVATREPVRHHAPVAHRPANHHVAVGLQPKRLGTPRNPPFTACDMYN